MADGKKSFVLYADLLDNIEHLTNEEKGILFNHLLEYVNDKNPILEDRILVTAWKPIEKQLKRDLKKFEEVKIKRIEAGKRSAELRALKGNEQTSTNSTSVESVKQTSTNSTSVESVKQTSTNSTVICNMIYDNDNDICNMIYDNDNDKCNINNSIISEIKNFDKQQNQSDIIILDSEKENNQKEKVPSKRKSEKDEFIEAFVSAGAFEDYAEEYYKYRVKKKLSLSKLAYNKIINESFGLNINEVIELCISKDWKGFKKEWYNNSNNQTNEKSTTKDRGYDPLGVYN